ncbi:PAS domain-containing hybrid sensor histidine kinase/response regulator [Geobacter argillaceus]|uniref:Sensory/regulatory protein RpfC n=1 Tax=Geobacter argillaceus TaxID=345631 RepID=A0A562V9A5_9BACT|nr:PAS domain-containing hybrid sensor histidine kinase/response regulator [Geobacter argillaceus]TWJ14317.1 PAS domain S-box-containing protein [Geobacter argillaceus]
MGIDNDKNQLTAADELRRRAEELFLSETTESLPPRIKTELQRLLHELDVHRIELEMQNAELRQARNEVETVREKYTDLYDFAPVGYFALDRDGTIGAANLSGASLLGIERSRLIGRRFGLFVTEEYRPAFTDFLDKVFTSPTKEAYEVKILKEEAPPLFVRIEAVAAASGQECRAALIDITERKQAEEELHESEERFRTLADAIPQLCWIANADGWIFWYNQRWYEYTGTTPQQMEGWGWQSVHDPEVLPQVLERWKTSIATGKPFDMVFPLRGSDGLFRPFLTRVMPQCAQDGKVVRWFGTNTDITERELAEEELRRAKKTAEAANRAKSQFLANMSHELRTPMTGILGMLQLVLEKELAPTLRDDMEMVLSSARSLLLIINDILDMAKIEAGRLVIEETVFSPRRCIAEAVDIFTPEVQLKGLDFSVSVAEELPDTIAGDQVRLRQVLTNLIGNAVKFTEAGKVVVHVTAGGTTSEGKREVTFAVTDTGIGIPDDKKELLFRAFNQVDGSHSRSFGGTGLGLAISKEIVELMGGTIGFVSEEGVGSTFSFTIPLGETGLDRHVLPSTEPQPNETTTPALQGERIPRLLLAEDDPATRKVLGLMLNRSNFDLDFAEDGLKAVELWEKGAYDLVLMDVQMPRLNGFEATSAIREKERERGGHTPIIALTAHAFKEDE